MVRNEPVETTGDAETADVAGTTGVTETSGGAETKVQTPAVTIKQQENIELRAKRDHLMRRKDMLCAQIALNIRLSGVESISDWVNRISKDVVAWRDALTNVESEIENVMTEIRINNYINECTMVIDAGMIDEKRLMHEISSIRSKRAELISCIDIAECDLNTLRGLSGVAAIPTLNVSTDLTAPRFTDNVWSTTCDCQLSDTFAADGQVHYCRGHPLDQCFGI